MGATQHNRMELNCVQLNTTSGGRTHTGRTGALGSLRMVGPMSSGPLEPVTA